MAVWQVDKSVKIDEISPLAIPKHISTISMHIPSLVEIHDVYSSFHPEMNYGRTDIQQADGRTDTWTSNGVSEIILSCPFGSHYLFCVIVKTEFSPTPG